MTRHRIVQAIRRYRRFDRAPLWMLGLGIPIWIVLNAGAVCFGCYFPAIWNDDTRVRPLRFPNTGVPIALVATPLWIGAACLKTWKESGALVAFGPLILTGSMLVVLVSGTFALHRMRYGQGELSWRQSRSSDRVRAESSSTILSPPK